MGNVIWNGSRWRHQSYSNFSKGVNKNKLFLWFPWWGCGAEHVLNTALFYKAVRGENSRVQSQVRTRVKFVTATLISLTLTLFASNEHKSTLTELSSMHCEVLNKNKVTVCNLKRETDCFWGLYNRNTCHFIKLKLNSIQLYIKENHCKNTIKFNQRGSIIIKYPGMKTVFLWDVKCS